MKMIPYFQDLIKWSNLLNQYIFEKPKVDIKPKSIMCEIESLITEMRPFRDTFPWDVENTGRDTDSYKQEANLYDLVLKDIILGKHAEFDKDVVVSDYFLNNLSSHWLIQIIKAQQIKDQETKTLNTPPSAPCNVELNENYPDLQKTTTMRKIPKKTHSEPHSISKKGFKRRSDLTAIKSMNDVDHLSKIQNNTKPNYLETRHIILNKTETEKQLMSGSRAHTPSSTSKSRSTCTQAESENGSDKTSASKVIHWLKSLPKDHQGMRNAKKNGKYYIKEKPRWVS